MDQFGFDFRDPQFEFAGWRLSQQLFTFENVYGLDPATLERGTDADRLAISASGLTWAGGQEKWPGGTASLTATRTADGIEIVGGGTHTETLRRNKIVLHGLPDGRVVGESWAESEIGNGQILVYPAMHVRDSRRLQTPLCFLKTADGEYLYFQCLETEVRLKTIAIFRDPMGDGITVELIHEELATKMGKTLQSPRWRVGRTRDPDAVVARHMAHLKETFGLVEWDKNPHVPAWLRRIGLVAYMHGQHWTGHIFNDYDAMLANLEALADRVGGEHILAHLAGWEGRYYWQYGEYWPEQRMGGEAAFRRLCDGARARGIRLQLMLGGNCANRALPGFWQWGETSYMHHASGAIEWGNKPDWDTSRAYDTHWQAWLNPGAPGWHEHLLTQASRLIETFGIDSIFLDTDGVWTNDPNHSVHEGMTRWRDELFAKYPEVILTGEHWWDALGGLSPLTHDDAIQNMARFGEHIAPFIHGYAHNSWGDPSRNSSGVFEGGFQPFKLVKEAPNIIPTLVIVDGTLANAPGGVDAVVAQAQRYIATLPTAG